jgi:DNA-directed RNA polymerase subunit RPC12/RpoP
MSSEERKANDEIDHALSHCADCDTKLKAVQEKEDMRCRKCQKVLEKEQYYG